LLDMIECDVQGHTFVGVDVAPSLLPISLFLSL